MGTAPHRNRPFGNYAVAAPAWERPARLAVAGTLAAAPLVLVAFVVLRARDRYFIEFDPISLTHTRVSRWRTRSFRWSAGDVADVRAVPVGIRSVLGRTSYRLRLYLADGSRRDLAASGDRALIESLAHDARDALGIRADDFNA